MKFSKSVLPNASMVHIHGILQQALQECFTFASMVNVDYCILYAVTKRGKDC